MRTITKPIVEHIKSGWVERDGMSVREVDHWAVKYHVEGQLKPVYNRYSSKYDADLHVLQLTQDYVVAE